jgi:hypothetical protein
MRFSCQPPSLAGITLCVSLLGAFLQCSGEGESGRDDDGHADTGGTGDGGGEVASGGGGDGDAASGGDGGSSPEGGQGGDGDGDGGESSESLSARYPGDEGIEGDEAVLFFDDFETGWGRWTAPQEDGSTLAIRNDENKANRGSRYLESTVTSADLEVDEYISSQSHIEFRERVDDVYLRFYALFVGTAPTPHHWVRMTAGTPGFNGSGRANTLPAGDEGFWFDFDANTDDVFNFYVYWHQMRSGRCNDGSATEGCEGDQGSTYYYGNNFRPPEQVPFPRDEWFCIEMRSKANTVGDNDGELTFWIDDEGVGDYRPGFPDGTWLRDSFHTGGCDFSACTEPAPFEGFDFRASDDVLFKAFVLDAYYERGSSQSKRETLSERGIVVDDAQTVLYDDIVIAKERIGCRRDE